MLKTCWLFMRASRGALPAEWPQPLHHSSPKYIRELAERGEWQQVIYWINSAERSNPLSNDLVSHVREARLAISVIECLTTQYAINQLTEMETKIIGECLNAAVHGPFFPDWEFDGAFQVLADSASRI